MDRLENELDEATPDAAAIQVREADLAKAQEELVISEGTFEDLKISKYQLDDENKANKREMDEAQKVVADYQFRLEDITVRSPFDSSGAMSEAGLTLLELR